MAGYDTQRWQKVREDGASQKQLGSVTGEKGRKCGAHSLSTKCPTSLCPSANTSDPNHTRQTQLTPPFSFGPNWMNGNCDLGSWTVQWGNHPSSATRPVLAETLQRGKMHLGSEAKRGRKEEDTVAQTWWKMEDILALKARGGRKEGDIGDPKWTPPRQWNTNHLGKHNDLCLIICKGQHRCKTYSAYSFQVVEYTYILLRKYIIKFRFSCNKTDKYSVTSTHSQSLKLSSITNLPTSLSCRRSGLSL